METIGVSQNSSEGRKSGLVLRWPENNLHRRRVCFGGDAVLRRPFCARRTRWIWELIWRTSDAAARRPCLVALTDEVCSYTRETNSDNYCAGRNGEYSGGLRVVRGDSAKERVMERVLSGKQASWLGDNVNIEVKKFNGGPHHV